MAVQAMEFALCLAQQLFGDEKAKEVSEPMVRIAQLSGLQCMAANRTFAPPNGHFTCLCSLFHLACSSLRVPRICKSSYLSTHGDGASTADLRTFALYQYTPNGWIKTLFVRGQPKQDASLRLVPAAYGAAHTLPLSFEGLTCSTLRRSADSSASRAAAAGAKGVGGSLPSAPSAAAQHVPLRDQVEGQVGAEEGCAAKR